MTRYCRCTETLQRQAILGRSRAHLRRLHRIPSTFQWARSVSPVSLVETGDPDFEWRERLLDAFGGFFLLAGRGAAVPEIAVTLIIWRGGRNDRGLLLLDHDVNGHKIYHLFGRGWSYDGILSKDQSTAGSYGHEKYRRYSQALQARRFRPSRAQRQVMSPTAVIPWYLRRSLGLSQPAIGGPELRRARNESSTGKDQFWQHDTRMLNPSVIALRLSIRLGWRRLGISDDGRLPVVRAASALSLERNSRA